jgi:transposase
MDYVLADKGYESDAFVAAIRAQQARPVTPPKKNRTAPRDYDKTLYKDHNLIERCFLKLKHFSCIATRYERLAITYQ